MERKLRRGRQSEIKEARQREWSEEEVHGGDVTATSRRGPQSRLADHPGERAGSGQSQMLSFTHSPNGKQLSSSKTDIKLPFTICENNVFCCLFFFLWAVEFIGRNKEENAAFRVISVTTAVLIVLHLRYTWIMEPQHCWGTYLCYCAGFNCCLARLSAFWIFYCELHKYRFLYWYKNRSSRTFFLI